MADQGDAQHVYPVNNSSHMRFGELQGASMVERESEAQRQQAISGYRASQAAYLFTRFPVCTALLWGRQQTGEPLLYPPSQNSGPFPKVTSDYAKGSLVRCRSRSLPFQEGLKKTPKRHMQRVTPPSLPFLIGHPVALSKGPL